jgi:hypothetical protein
VKLVTDALSNVLSPTPMQHDFPLILFEMIELTDALSNVLSPTPIAKTGRP